MEPSHVENAYKSWCFKESLKEIADEVFRLMELRNDLAQLFRENRKKHDAVFNQLPEEDYVFIEFMDTLREENPPMAEGFRLSQDDVEEMAGSERMALVAVIQGTFIGWCFSRWMIARDTRRKIERYTEEYLDRGNTQVVEGEEAY